MRTNYCGLISEQYLDQTVTVKGWVHRRRDHGGVILSTCATAKASFKSLSTLTLRKHLPLPTLPATNTS